MSMCEYSYTPAQSAFDQWLGKNGFERAVEVCPIDDGEFLFTDGQAYEYVDDFLADHPEYENDRKEVEQYAINEVGEVSKAFSDADAERYIDGPEDC